MIVEYSRDVLKFLSKLDNKSFIRIKEAIIGLKRSLLREILNYCKDDRNAPGKERFAYEFVKKLVLAWDPDFVKVTEEEKTRIIAAKECGFISEDEIDWDNLGKYSS